MKTIRQIALAYQQGKSDKVYEVDLCQVGDGQYVVNFRYGRRGSRLKDGTKTVLPVPLDEAEKIYTKLVDSKKDKGYWDSPGGTPSISTPTRVSTPTDMDKVLKKRRQVVLEQFRDAVSVPGSGARPLNRLAWRVGQLRIKDAGPLLMKLVDAPDPMTRYCTMWSLGRIQHEPAAAALEKICISASQQGPLENIAREAYRDVLLNRTVQGETLFKSLSNQFPEPVRNYLR
ncbi:MAG: WGR domain-containing protein [bacterium]|nr:WGR domain-containing protein [bacterium]